MRYSRIIATVSAIVAASLYVAPAQAGSAAFAQTFDVGRHFVDKYKNMSDEEFAKIMAPPPETTAGVSTLPDMQDSLLKNPPPGQYDPGALFDLPTPQTAPVIYDPSLPETAT